MKLQRSTGALLGVAIALVTTVAILETTKSTSSDGSETLYDFTESDVSAFSIDREGTDLTFTKDNDIWKMIEPEATEADPSSVAFLLNILTTDTIQETIVVLPEQLADYGLDQPSATVDLTVGEAEYTLAIGNEDFSGSSLYAVTDSTESTEMIEVYLIPKELENALDRPLADWISETETDDIEQSSAERDQPAVPEDSSDSSPELSADKTSESVIKNIENENTDQ